MTTSIELIVDRSVFQSTMLSVRMEESTRSADRIICNNHQQTRDLLDDSYFLLHNIR